MSATLFDESTEDSLLPTKYEDDKNPMIRTSVNRADNEVSLLNKATWLSCYANLTSTIIGAGILGLPYAFAHMGWIFGSIFIILCGMASCMSLHFLSMCARKTASPSSFYSVAEASVPSLSFVIDLAVALKCYGVATSYLIVIGDLMPAAMRQLGSLPLWKHRTPWVLLGFAIVAPLSCLQSLDALKYTSSLSIVFIIFLVFLVMLYAVNTPGLDPCQDNLDDSGDCVGDRSFFALSTSSLSVLTIFVFGYTCQQNAFAVTNELRQPTQDRVNTVFMASIGTAAVLYFLVAVFGYHTYGNNVLSDLLKSYPENSVTSAARLFVSLIVAFHYPLQCNPARKSVLSLWKHFTGGKEPNSTRFRFRYCLITAVFLGTSLLIALTIKDLGIMLGVVGATGSTIVSYILPGLFFYQMYKTEANRWKLNVALALVVVGLIIMPLALFFIFSEIA